MDSYERFWKCGPHAIKNTAISLYFEKQTKAVTARSWRRLLARRTRNGYETSVLPSVGGMYVAHFDYKASTHSLMIFTTSQIKHTRKPAILKLINNLHLTNNVASLMMSTAK